LARWLAEHPVLVLFDERALQDHRRATIVGTRTFGLPGLILSDDNAVSLLPIINSTIERVYEYSGHPKPSVALESSDTIAAHTTHQTYSITFGDL